jgi:hypothetical protein
VYVAGWTSSADFPGTIGGAQPAYAGGPADGFVARLNGALTTLAQATYLGGLDDDKAFGLAVRPTTGEVYVAGFTASLNFPGTLGGAQPAYAGNFDAFVARLNGALTVLTQATYLGGSGIDQALAGTLLAIHPTTGDVYLAGLTNSPNFPGTPGGAQPANAGGFDAFVARLNGALTGLTQATYLGGGVLDEATGLAIHPMTGDVYVTGFTDSTNFPGTTGGAQPTFGGATDAFAARLNGALTVLIQATYLGGSGSDLATTLAIHPTGGDLYVTGRTASSNFPGALGGAQPAFAGGPFDAFVARLTPGLALVDATASVPTLSEWAHILLLVLLVGGGIWALGRRRAAA